MNQLFIFTGVEENECNVSMVKIVIGGGTQDLLNKREKRIDKRYGSSLKSKWL